MHKNILSEGGVALLILLFLYTALSKLLDFQAFHGQLLLQPFPRWSVVFLQWGLPAIELLACWLLLRRRTRLSGLYLSAALMAVFTGYIALVLSGAFGSIPCSCGGVLEQLSWEAHLLFNCFFVAIAIIAIRLHVNAHLPAASGTDRSGQERQKGGEWQESR